MLKADELVVNRKHTSQSYAEEKLQLRSQRKNKFKGPRMPLVVSIGANIRWSIDFVSDSLSIGRRFRVLNIKDDYSRELIGQLVSYSLSGLQVARFLDQLIEKRSAPDQITSDNGTDFTSKGMFFWQKESGVKLGFIQLGKRTLNAFV